MHLPIPIPAPAPCVPLGCNDVTGQPTDRVTVATCAFGTCYYRAARTVNATAIYRW